MIKKHWSHIAYKNIKISEAVPYLSYLLLQILLCLSCPCYLRLSEKILIPIFQVITTWLGIFLEG